MAGLLYKEYIINKKNIFLHGFFVLLLTFLMLIPLPLMFRSNNIVNDKIAVYICQIALMSAFAFIFMITGSDQQFIFSSDERKKWCDYIASTPVSVKGQVFSKYFFSLILSVTALIYCILVNIIIAAIQGADSNIVKFVFGMFVLQIFLRAAEYPFLVRFGYKSGSSFRTAAFLTAVFIIFVYGLFGNLSWLGTYDDFMEWFIKLMAGQFNNKILFVTRIMPFAAVALYYFSYRISCRLYLKGAENYDK